MAKKAAAKKTPPNPKRKFEKLGLKVRPLNYTTVKELYLKGINLADLKEEQVFDAMMVVLINSYPSDEEQAILGPLSVDEQHELFRITMDETNKAETKN